MIAVPMGNVNFDQVHVPNPAAGVNFDWTTYAGYSHLLIAVEYQLTCDGTVLNRVPGLTLQIQGIPAHVYNLTYTGNCPAGTVRIMNYYAGIDRNASGIVMNRDQIALPFPIYMRPGDHVISTVVNLQAGDQISNIYIYLNVFHIT